LVESRPGLSIKRVLALRSRQISFVGLDNRRKGCIFEFASVYVFKAIFPIAVYDTAPIRQFSQYYFAILGKAGERASAAAQNAMAERVHAVVNARPPQIFSMLVTVVGTTE
jgi:hypothetical protein